MRKTFFRYAGGKGKVINDLLGIIKEVGKGCGEYREPFFGGGSVGLEVMDRGLFDIVWINDKDYGLSCLWNSVINYSEGLKELVMGYEVNVEDFYKFKEDLKLCYGEVLEMGFKKLVIQQTSYSGLGLMAGSPIGGRDQSGSYKIGCRWNAKRICKKIGELNLLMKVKDGECGNIDYGKMMEGDSNVFLYLDPPYYHQGGNLYFHGFDQAEHIRLAGLLEKTECKWLLSYDDCEEVRKLYEWARVEEIGLKYSINSKKGNVGKELIIRSW